MHKKIEEVLRTDKELAQALLDINGSYDDFVIGIFSGYNIYPDLKEKILGFLHEHESATPSDIIIFYAETFRKLKRKVKYSFEDNE